MKTLDLKNSKFLNNNSISENFLNIALYTTNLGKTTSGFNFERTSSGVIHAPTAYLRPIFAAYDFIAKIAGGPVIVRIEYINKGPRERMMFQAKAKYGSISNPNQTKKIGSTAFISFKYKPPSSSTKKGKTDIITVAAARYFTGEIFTQQVSILLKI